MASAARGTLATPKLPANSRFLARVNRARNDKFQSAGAALSPLYRAIIFFRASTVSREALVSFGK